MSIEKTKAKINVLVKMPIYEFVRNGSDVTALDLQALARSHDALLEATKAMRQYLAFGHPELKTGALDEIAATIAEAEAQ